MRARTCCALLWRGRLNAACNLQSFDLQSSICNLSIFNRSFSVLSRLHRALYLRIRVLEQLSNPRVPLLRLVALPLTLIDPRHRELGLPHERKIVRRTRPKLTEIIERIVIAPQPRQQLTVE